MEYLGLAYLAYILEGCGSMFDLLGVSGVARVRQSQQQARMFDDAKPASQQQTML